VGVARLMHALWREQLHSGSNNDLQSYDTYRLQLCHNAKQVCVGDQREVESSLTAAIAQSRYVPGLQVEQNGC
jgi:hypothetical protein